MKHNSTSKNAYQDTTKWRILVPPRRANFFFSVTYGRELKIGIPHRPRHRKVRTSSGYCSPSCHKIGQLLRPRCPMHGVAHGHTRGPGNARLTFEREVPSAKLRSNAKGPAHGRPSPPIP